MGYDATCDGWIRFRQKPPETVIEKGKYAFGHFSCENEAPRSVYGSESECDIMYSIYGFGRYYEGEVYDFLNEAAKYAESGEIRYTGEDNCSWKFTIKNNCWEEYEGQTVYDDEPKLNLTENEQEEFVGQLIDQFQDALDHSAYALTIDGGLYDDVKAKLVETLKNWGVL